MFVHSQVSPFGIEDVVRPGSCSVAEDLCRGIVNPVHTYCYFENVIYHTREHDERYDNQPVFIPPTHVNVTRSSYFKTTNYHYYVLSIDEIRYKVLDAFGCHTIYIS